LPEALARSRNDSVLSRPARSKNREGFARTLIRPFLSRPARTIAGATLAAILTGIVINALMMQKERRSAPFFAAPRPAATAVEPAPRAAAPIVESAPVVAQPPARPADLGGANEPVPVPPSRSGDPIRDLLRGDSANATARSTIAVQNALIKLGFSLKADGVVGASTEQAIQQFERSHGLAPSIEITAKLVKQLSAAANAAAH
jgi:Putative peptidoglycan binding domain